MPEAIRFIVVALLAGIGGFGPVLGIGLIGKAALEAVGRSPHARGPIMTNMVVAIAFAEAVAIYVLIVCFLLIFVGR